MRWEAVTACDVMEDAGTETLIKERGVARELQPLDLEHEPDLAAVASCVDLEALVDHQHASDGVLDGPLGAGRLDTAQS